MIEAKAVVFDMDGVIVDSEPRHERAVMEVVKDLGYGENHGIVFSNYLGRTDREVWADFVKRHQPPHSLEELLGLKRERVLEILRQDKPLFKGLPELVEKLAGNYKLGVASGSDPLVVQEVLQFNELRRFFSVVVTASQVKRGKPAPDIYLRASELLGCDPGACWAIEDSKPGVAAALAAGMRVIAITNTLPAVELGHATNVVNSYEQIEKLLLPV